LQIVLELQLLCARGFTIPGAQPVRLIEIPVPLESCSGYVFGPLCLGEVQIPLSIRSSFLTVALAVPLKLCEARGLLLEGCRHAR
jgi:hypothetical protein